MDFVIFAFVVVVVTANVISISAGMIYGKRLPFMASALCWTAWGLIHHFFKSDAMPDPAPTTTKIPDI